jgi:DNA-binding CsgD family transcriptional regulator
LNKGDVMDTKLFTRLYKNGKSYKKMSDELGVSISTIQAYKKRLNLPTRAHIYEYFPCDEALFKELYGSGATYAQIAEVFGCSPATVMAIRQRLGLSDREIQRVKVNKEIFIDMYNSDKDHIEIAQALGISVKTIQRKRKQYRLPKRVNPCVYSEDEFRAAYDSGLSGYKLASKFNMSRMNVGRIVKKLGLPALRDRQAVAPVIEPVRPARRKSKIAKETFRRVIDPIIEKTPEHVIEPQIPDPIVLEHKIHGQRPQYNLPPTLREVQRRNQLQKQRQIVNRYKIAHKENGFTSLVKPEINNSIVSERI